MLGFERLYTRYFFPYVICFSIAALVLMYISVTRGWLSQQQLSTGVDIAVKTLAVIVSSAWALNRYYTSRTDAPQVRIDPLVEVVTGEDTPIQKLLLFRLDVVNTGKVRIDGLEESVHAEIVILRGSEVKYEKILEWPNEPHLFGIEPGSWSAVNFEIPLPQKAVAVRLLMVLSRKGEPWMTWHRTFSVRPK